MAKKEIFYQGLADLQVAIDDFSTTSPDYFRVTKAPTELYSGLNIFKFKGNPSLFVDEAPVYIEVLDSNGSPIYYEVGLDFESAEQSAVVTIHINEDVTPGTGYIVMCGIVKQSAEGILLDTSGINLRWHIPVYIDPSKRNETEIVFDSLPSVTVTGGTDTYANPNYKTSSSRYNVVSIENLDYYYYNNTAIIATSSLSTFPFETNVLSAVVYINVSDLSNTTPILDPDTSTSVISIPVTSVTSGFIILKDYISQPISNSNSRWEPSDATIDYLEITYEYSGSLDTNQTENSYNVVNISFDNLTPQLGTVAKIRSYYKSTGVGAYTLINETDILDQATEFGFTPDQATVSFALPTVQRNDRIDFKFEFVNPYGTVSKQVIESLNNLFIGGNTYIAGDDNLLTGSLFVAGATGTGVQITGKGSSAMIKSLGYTGFNDALNGSGQSGFVLYSGSISPIIGEQGVTNNYSGVGLELIANSDSYFKYSTANGGVLDIRTDKFFIGNSDVFLSGSNGNLEIYHHDNGLTKFHLQTNGFVTASAFIAFTGSSDANNYLMMDTSIGLIDGKNIGRILFTQGPPQTIPNTTAASGMSTSNFLLTSKQVNSSTILNASKIRSENLNAMTSSYKWRAIPGTEDVSFYTLPFENQITVFGNVYIEKLNAGTGSSGFGGPAVTGACDPALTLAFNFSLWEPRTGGFFEFGQASSGSGGSFLGGVSGTVLFSSSGSSITHELTNIGNYTYNVASTPTGSAAVRQMLPFKVIIPLPTSASDKLVTFTSDYQLIKVWGGKPTVGSYSYNDNFMFRAKIANMTAIIGRVLQSTATSGVGQFVSYTGGGFVDL